MKINIKKKVIDPVCGKRLDQNYVSRSAQYKDRLYCFCSPECHYKFIIDPEKFDKPRSVLIRILNRLIRNDRRPDRETV
jgi:YHS domain-containing protein